MMNCLRYRQPWRRWIVKIANLLVKRGRCPEWLLMWLYPDDMEIEFRT